MIFNSIFCIASLFNFDNAIIENNQIQQKGVQIDYPCIVGLDNQNIMEDYVVNEKEKFLKNYQEGYQLIITYDTYQTKHFIGFVFKAMWDTHGAHPNTYIKTFNYSVNGYIEPDKYTKNDLTFFANYCSSNLKNQLIQMNMYNQQMFETGIAVNKENYQNIIELDSSYLVFFSQYQIAPYVAGILCCDIPKAIPYSYLR